VTSDEDLYKWVAPGFDVTLEYPTEESPKYRATVQEFGLSSEGESLDEAYEAVLTRVVQMAVDRMLHGRPLPYRTAWLKEHEGESDRGIG
jgi:hypothetical protein